jgi:hypothetical protein
MRLRLPSLPASLRLPALRKGLPLDSPLAAPSLAPPQPWIRRLPLRITLLVTAALVAAPSALLLRLPRPRAEGLGRLLPHAALLQSFPASPERGVPQLWQQRLPGPVADQFWRQQRQNWWQFWGQDGTVGAYLVMPTPRPVRLGALARPANSVEVDGLLVVAPNSLSLALLSQKLRSAPRQQRGLQQRCLELLERRQSAYWNVDGLGSMAGELAPLLQAFQEGCVELQLAEGSLQFQGEAGAVSGLLAPATGAPSTPVVVSGPAGLPPPLGNDLLLQVSGPSLQPLLDGLLRRDLIREPLITAYGLTEADLRLLKDSPFLLSLRPLASGPFLAGLELVVAPKGERKTWTRMLDGISERLFERGLQVAAETATSWRDADERIVGGWRWLADQDQPLLQLFLGSEPPPFKSPFSESQAWNRLPGLRLQARPSALAAVSLLPLQLPMPLQQADQLQVLAETGSEGKDSPSRLLGRLAITPRQPIPQPQLSPLPQRQLQPQLPLQQAPPQPQLPVAP